MLGEAPLTPLLAAAEGEAGVGLPMGLKIFLGVVGALIAVFVAVHLAGGGLGSHGH